MSEQFKRSRFMDYRNSVPFMDLSGFVMQQPCILEDKPAMNLQEQLIRKKMTRTINLRRLQYCKLVEEYKNGRR